MNLITRCCLKAYQRGPPRVTKVYVWVAVRIYPPVSFGCV